jgi:hypothetical protein
MFVLSGISDIYQKHFPESGFAARKGIFRNGWAERISKIRTIIRAHIYGMCLSLVLVS